MIVLQVKGGLEVISSGADEYISYVVDKYSSTLLKVAFTVLHDRAEAEDAVQETFISLMRTEPAFKDREHEKAWLIRVTINISRNMRKKQSRIQPLDLDVPEPEGKVNHVLETVLNLPEKYSTIVHLYYYEGYSLKEIGDILRLPAATVGTRLARARQILKKQLEGDESNV